MELTAPRVEEFCDGCGATAKLHLQNPFGVYYVDSDRRYYFTWMNRPSVSKLKMCEMFLTESSYLDHDDLFRYVSSR